MPTLSVTFNGTAQDLTDFCDAFAYQATIDGEPNPETKQQFFTRKMKEYANEVVKSFRANRDAETARQTAIANSNSAF